jgi:phosphoribosylformylglycinamidine synthase
MVAAFEDVRRAVTTDFKAPGDPIYQVGPTHDELGGSCLYRLAGHLGARVPQVRPEAAAARYRRLSAATARGLVASCHDLSDGGLAVAAAESAFAGGFGMKLDLVQVPFAGEPAEKSDAVLLFSESASRLLVTVRAENAAAFEKAMAGNVCARIGEVVADGSFSVTGVAGATVVKTDIGALKASWQEPLKEL